MLISTVAIIGGLSLLVYGSNQFVVGASATARNLGVSPLIIGLTVVAFATSAPEMLVAADAAWKGTPGIAVGNAIGSNIANIGLVLGVTALIQPMLVRSGILKREYPIMFVALGVAFFLVLDGSLDRSDGIILAAGMFVMIAATVRLGTHSKPGDPLAAEFEQEMTAADSTGHALTLLVIGLLIMLAGAHVLVWGAVDIARAFGVGELIIGLTIVAVGTSLPELAASITSCIKGEPDIALGNVLGSNMFNILGVLSLPALIHPTTLEQGAISRDFPMMIGLSVLLFFISFGFRGPGRINRYEGALLLLCFCAYQWWLIAGSVAK